ncbi:MAG: phosphonopyruvate decarboxylase [Treponema sp.]|nr:phosphonopyruvate decarboxylase [Treponema sp.]
MIKPETFYNELIQKGTDFFTGVPDSLLKNFCAYVTDNAPAEKHIIAANEGNATGLAAGYHFATGKVPLIYMQNSGLGNVVNPILSLADPDVYSIPCILVVGWRGEPGVHDEPQHVKQGKVTCALLDAMQIPYVILTDDEADLHDQIEKCFSYVRENNAPYAFVVKKGTFGDYKLKNNIAVNAEMTREEALEKIMLSASSNTAFVSTTGMASRELFELRVKHGQGHEKDFLTVGSMGHASQIALSIALQKKERKVYCIDGDGAVLMHLGGMAIIGSRSPNNYVHIVLNNNAHDSVGGQPTVGGMINLTGIAKSCGYKKIYKAETIQELEAVLKSAREENELTFIEVKVKKGARKDLGRPTTTPIENKNAFMEFLK